VLDPGSHTTRAGYAGEDTPRVITPSYVGLTEHDPDLMDLDGEGDGKAVKKRINTYYAESSINFPKSGAQLKPIVQDGLIVDWDSAVEQWEYIFDNLRVDYKEQPLLLTEPVWNTAKNRTKSLEVALEQFEFPGFYLASSPTCVAFAQGRPSALVVDIGHDIVSVTPVVDGMCLAKSTLKTHYAGKYLSTQLQKRIDAVIVPLYKVKSKVFTSPTEEPNWIPKSFENITKSYDDYQLEQTIHSMKETLLQIPREPITDATFTPEEIEEKFPKRTYELPNGHAISMSQQRFEVGDSLFEPENYQVPEFPAESGEPEIQSKNDYVPIKRSFNKKANDDDEPTKLEDGVPTHRGLTQLTSHALSLVDVDIRAQLAHNIIVTGASSLITGLNERLYVELSKLHPGLKIRVHANGNSAERKFQSWIGGSVLSSLGTFHQLWVSKKEVEEVGVDRLLAQRFR
jgi:actin-related protein 4